MKCRIPYLLAVIITMALGYSSREFADVLPSFIVEHAGDALWASMIYFGFRFIIVEKSMRVTALISLLFCYGIEISQLYQANWINAIRSHPLGALVLGHGFLVLDLVRYTVGVALAWLVDRFLFRKRLLSRQS